MASRELKRLIAGRKPSPEALYNAQRMASEISRISSDRLDADETVMLALQLEQMTNRVYDEPLTDLKARQFIPSTGSGVDTGADTFAYAEGSFVGQAKIISDDAMSDDPPSVEVKQVKLSNKIVAVGGAYFMSLQDVRRAAFSGNPIEERKALAMRRAAEDKLDQIAAVGAPTEGIALGLLNRTAGTSAGNIPGTAMTAASWDVTPVADGGAGMLDNLNTAVAEMMDLAKGKGDFVPDSLLLPIKQYQRLFSTRNTTTGKTVAEMFKESNPFIRNIDHWVQLNDPTAAGAGNNARGLLYKKSLDVLELVIPQEFEVLPPQQHNYGFKVLCHLRTAGAIVYQPLGLRYLTGLPNNS